MTHGSLFSGLGGFDLAAQWMGWTNSFHCEIDPFCQRILKHYWTDAHQYTDIRDSDFTIWRDRIDILTGGFPCQPFSTAGKRKGTDDERHLWPEMLRAIREIRPRWIVGENVPGILSWNGGMVFKQVCADLEAEGYKILILDLPACGIDAPHKRERIWFVAHTNLNANLRKSGKNEGKSKEQRIQEWNEIREFNEPDNLWWGFAYSDSSERCGGRLHTQGPKEATGHIGSRDTRSIGRTWQNFPTQSPLCTGDDGLSTRLDGITFPKLRTESVKAAGNAIVPQVALQIFKAIEMDENSKCNEEQSFETKSDVGSSGSLTKNVHTTKPLKRN